MTYKELAFLAGVSASTVSKVFSGSPEISQETKDRICALAEEYGVSRVARHRNATSLRIAILVPEIVSILYAQEVTNLIKVIRRKVGEPAVYVTGFGSVYYNRVINQILQDKSADGIISMTHCRYPNPLPIPLVCYCGYWDSKHDTVMIDYQKIMDDAVCYLAKLGHRSIGYIGEKNTPLQERCFRDAMEKQHIPLPEESVFVSAKRFEESGKDAARSFSRQTGRPTAFVCAYDEIAIGAIKSFRRLNIRVPEDVSLIGINNIPSAIGSKFSLTTFRFLYTDLFEKMLDCLLRQLQNPGCYAPTRIMVSAELVVRGSTGKAPRTEP